MGRSEGDGRLIRRIKAKGDDNWVVVKWEYVDGPVEVVVVKSETGPAKDLGQLFVERPDHRAIFFDEGTRCQDQDVVSDVRYYYTLFAQDQEGRWHRQGDTKVRIPRDFQRERVDFHEPGSMLAKLDKLRAGAFLGGGGGM
jgi:hypothetical protein